MEQIDGLKILQVREVRVPELPHFRVDGYCPENRKIYELFWCHFHCHTCQPFRDVKTLNGDTLAELYERTRLRF